MSWIQTREALHDSTGPTLGIPPPSEDKPCQAPPVKCAQSVSGPQVNQALSGIPCTRPAPCWFHSAEPPKVGSHLHLFVESECLVCFIPSTLSLTPKLSSQKGQSDTHLPLSLPREPVRAGRRDFDGSRGTMRMSTDWEVLLRGGERLGNLRFLLPPASSSSAWAEFSGSAGTFHMTHSPAWILPFPFPFP